MAGKNAPQAKAKPDAKAGRGSGAAGGRAVPMSRVAEGISRSLGEPAWLLRKRLEAVALLEKRNGRAEVSGKFAKGRLAVDAKIKGSAAVLTIQQALSGGNALEEQFGKPFSGHEPDNCLISFALFTEAAVVAADSGKPAEIALELSGKPPEHFATFFVFADHSEATVLVKRNFAQDGNECSCAVVGKGANVQFCSVRDDAPKTDSAIGMCASLGEGAALKLLNSNIGGSLRDEQVLILQNERGSRCEHYEASISYGSQKITKSSDHLHVAPDTFSRSVFKYATAGNSQVRVDGKVTIEKSAPGSDTHLLAKSLLLSDRAISHVVPQLYVRNAQVMAGHGSAMTPLDKEELFYLQSRGIGENESKLMVLQGFLQEIIAKSEIAQWLAAGVEAELSRAAGELYRGE